MLAKGKKVLLAVALAIPLLAGCGGGNEGSGSGSESISGSEGGSSQVVADPLPEGWDGIVRIYYRNDTANYLTKTIWVWGVGVDGVEYEFDNAGNPDSYGLYYDIDLSESPWNRTVHSSISFIIKERGTWAGQSADIVCTLNDYSSTLETTDTGDEMISIYSWDLGNSTIDVSANRNDALGDRIGSAVFTDWRTLHVEGTGIVEGRDETEVGVVSSYELYAYDTTWYRLNSDEQIGKKQEYLIKSGNPNSSSFDITFDEDITLYTDYMLECRFVQNEAAVKRGGASFQNLYDDPKFIENYTYDGDDLGFTDLSEGESKRFQFKVWAPTAGSVAVKLYQSGTPKALGTEEHPGDDSVTRLVYMTPDEKGVWTGELRGFYCDMFNFYTYAVSNGGTTQEAADPYATSAGINGVRSAIIRKADLPSTYPEGWEESLAKFKSNPEDPSSYISPNDLTIYEVHIRDFTADETWVSKEGNKNGTYNAFVEEGTTYGSVSTGFDSLKELGVNAVQILPVFDQDNDERTLSYEENGQTIMQEPSYNWGYNPLNYNVVEGAYSSDPYDPLVRMYEFRHVIQKLADAGIRTIMDVVYNHMSSVSGSSFNKIVPGYFFKMDENGAYIDETGVHNTFATNRTMGSKFVVDSTKYWLENFGIQGFRFDLMGAIETSTMRAVKDMAYDIDPNIVVYGEPWRGSGSSTDTQAGKVGVYRDLTDNGKGAVGAFNDCGRNGLKGDTTWGSPAPSYGFMSQGAGDFDENTMYNAACVYLGENREVKEGNGLATSVNQTINYVSCHDNYTLYDQLNYTYDSGNNADTDENTAVKDAVLATTAYVLFSQGVAFVHGGEEILRQKVMKPDNEYWEKIDEGDYVTLPSGNRLVRNSYAYGDEVNSYKWDRKVEFKEYFDKYAEAIHTRQSLIEEGILGVSDEVIQGSYQSGDAQMKYSRLWDSLTERGSYCGKDNVLRPVLAAQTEFTKIDGSTLPDVYSFLGGRMNDTPSCKIGIGSGELRVLYGTNREAGSTITVTNSLDVGCYEFLFVARVN